MRVRWLSAVVAVCAAAGSGGQERPPDLSLEARLARVDEAWPARDLPGRMEAMLSDLQAAAALAPQDYGVLWQLARHYFWLSDDPSISDEEKSRLGKIAWDHGDRDTVANPDRVEGWFYA